MTEMIDVLTAQQKRTIKNLARQGCTVVNLDAFQSLYPGKPTELFLNDFHHLTPFHGSAGYRDGYGAIAYMDWLSGQMLNDPKIAAALQTPRKREEFFVKKYTKEMRRTIAGYFKKEPAKTDEPIHVAAPPNATQIR